MRSPKTNRRPSQDPWFETTGTDAPDYIPISAWEPALNEDHAWTPAGRLTAVHDELPVELEKWLMESRSTNYEDVIGQEVKSIVVDLVVAKLSTLIEESLDDILRKSLHSAQNGIRSVIYNINAQVMLDLCHKDVIGDTMDAHIAKFLDTNAAADRLSQRLLTLSTFMSPLVTFMRRKIDTAKEEYSTAFLTKDPINTVERNKDVTDSLPSRSDSRTDETLCRKLWERRANGRHSKR